ncbi:sugar transferase [Amylibacter sp.]|nr:sugar transferase [Amylibacter sp.]
MNRNNNILSAKLFWFNKRIFDIIISLALLPLLVLFCIILILLNIFYNSGKLFFIQERMGRNCIPFFALKFRTMCPTDTISRKYYEPVEINRITPLGKLLRKTRIDELPQIINVIKGDMSLIGPRPDYYEHAVIFLENVKGYRERHFVRPGISGLSQIRLGYAEGLEETAKKVIIDNYYIQNTGYYFELKIIFSTLITIISGAGN